MHHFPAAKCNRHLDLVSLAYKFPDTALLDIHVVNVGPGPHLDFLDVDNGLFLFGLLRLFALFITEFAIIHYAAYRRAGVGRHLNKIEPPVPGPVKGFVPGYNSKLLTVFIDKPDLAGPDPLVNIDGAFFCDTAPPLLRLNSRGPNLRLASAPALPLPSLSQMAKPEVQTFPMVISKINIAGPDAVIRFHG